MINERRRFFRINDSIGVSYRLLTAEELDQTPPAEHPDDALSLIARCDSQIEQLLGRLRIKEPLVGEVFDAFNKKLNAIIDQFSLESRIVERLALKTQEVNISACGMALVVDEVIATGQVMSLDLLLSPGNLHIYTRGIVVASEPAAEPGHYYIRLDFQDMSHSDQEILIQHIVKRQGSLIRMIREEGGSP